ncbi:MAG: insulinase family protein [Chitinophagaceae bacterium]|nr:insulinase family protein [Chitinophagaceae bacterium]
MKKIIVSIIALAATLATQAQSVNRSIRPQPGPAPEISLGKSESFTLSNGMKVFVVENHKLPTIECSIQFDVRPELEGDMAGYREMMSELLMAGTTTRSKDKLNEEIDRMGAGISVSSEGMNAGGLKKYQDKIMELMADIAMNAQITQDELDKTKKKMLSNIETQKNQPDAMVNNVSAVVNYGANHPYGEVATEGTVKNITLNRCISYYRTYFKPGVAYMAIVGDVTAAEMKPLVEKYFGKWQNGTVPVATYPTPASVSNKTKVAFAARNAAVQSVVAVTYAIPDLKPGADDVIKVKVANTILGGGSQGRLFLNIREKHGWGYGSYSSIQEDIICGNFNASLKCKNVVSDSALEALLNEMRIIRTELVSDSTLRNTISYISGNFAIGLEDPRRIAQFAINTERYHMPKDYYRNYLKNLAAVTPADVLAAAQKYIRPDNANIVVAGSKEEVANKLARFSADNKLDYYDYAGRPVAATETKAAPLGLSADDVYKKYVAAIGGEAAIKKVKDLSIVSNAEVQGMQLTITVKKKEGFKLRETVDVDMNGNKMTVQKKVFNGAKGYMEQQGQKKDMDAEEIAETKEEADIQIDLHGADYGIKRTLKGMETVEGANAYIVEAVGSDNKKTIEYYDEKTGLKVRETRTAKDPQGNDVPMSTDMSDYREVPGTGGYKVPYFISIPGPGGMNLSMKVKSVDVNKGIADTEFN